MTQNKIPANEQKSKLGINMPKSRAELGDTSNFHTPNVTKYQSKTFGPDGTVDDDDIVAADGLTLSSSEFREAFKAVTSKLDE